MVKVKLRTVHLAQAKSRSSASLLEKQTLIFKDEDDDMNEEDAVHSVHDTR